jgi:hypothetical protein
MPYVDIIIIIIIITIVCIRIQGRSYERNGLLQMQQMIDMKWKCY